MLGKEEPLGIAYTRCFTGWMPFLSPIRHCERALKADWNVI